MRRDPQRGVTLVELLVSMAVMAILLVGLGSALENVSGRYQAWVDRLTSASTGDALTTNLQADSHRYAPCSVGSLGQQLDLCAPDRPGIAVVSYTVSGAAPYVVTRHQPAASAGTFVARGQTAAQPVFAADCLDAGGTVSGHIVVNNVRTNGSALSVYYSAPWRAGCAP